MLCYVPIRNKHCIALHIYLHCNDDNVDGGIGAPADGPRRAYCVTIGFNIIMCYAIRKSIKNIKQHGRYNYDYEYQYNIRLYAYNIIRCAMFHYVCSLKSERI